MIFLGLTSDSHGIKLNASVASKHTGIPKAFRLLAVKWLNVAIINQGG